MYEPGTILRLKEPYDNDQGAAAYNRVRVIGNSPGGTMPATDWVGVSANGIIIAPEPDDENAPFGANVVKPFGELKQLYDVEYIPDPTEMVARPVQRYDISQLGESPEEVFAREAPGDPNDKRRFRPETEV